MHPERHIGVRETIAMSVLALAVLTALRVAGVLAPVPIALLVAMVAAAVAMTTITERWGPRGGCSRSE